MSALDAIGMKTIRSFVACLLGFALSSCATSDSKTEQAGRLLFSIRTTQGAFFGVMKERDGVFFYTGDRELISAHRFSRGKKLDVFGDSHSSRELLRDIAAVAFEPFDFDEEVRRVDQILAEKNKNDGTTILAPFVFDGAEFEIRFVHGSVNFALTRWNPGVQIEFYSVYSPQIAKLKAVIDMFACYYGKSAFRLI